MRRNSQRLDVVLGIDIGTQSAKCVVLDVEGRMRGVGQESYAILAPRTVWAEQLPGDWWKATVNAVREALHQSRIPAARVQGIGVTGQMHGVVLVGTDLAPLRPAIIWMDRRSANLCATILARVSPETAAAIAGNRLAPGFAAASLAWLREVEPDLLDQARAALQPKDYIVLRLTGELSADPSDASATWLYDITRGGWSETLAAACGVSPHLLPPILDSAAVAGELRPESADQLGLRPGIPVVAGAGDQAALLLGMGVVEPGRGSITLGTGAQITVVSHSPRIDPGLRLNTFCHAVPERWYTMGAILNGGIVLSWWRAVIGGKKPPSYSTLLAEAARIPAGSEGLFFLPYLEGERTPHMDPGASGAFVGLTTRHTQGHLTRAVLEGVAYALRDCLLMLQAVGPTPDHFLIGGGGSQSEVWRQVMASMLGVMLQTVSGAEHTALGAALLAGLGAGMFYDLAQATALTVHYSPPEAPDPGDQAVYAEQHAQYQALYPALRSLRE
jgi:xylulokinase